MSAAPSGIDGPVPAVRSGDAPADRREIRAVLGGLMIMLALAAIDQSIVTTALPRIVGDLGGMTHLSWVVTAYVLASTSVMPLYGKLSDQYGRKTMIYVAVTVFLVGSALSGAAQTLAQLIAFRAIQGLGAGGLLPLSQIIIGDLVPPARRGRRQGAIASVFAVCSVIGPLVGGVITDLLSWHWIFYVNLPVGVLALWVIARALKRRNPRRPRRIDYPGAILMTATTAALLVVLALGGNEWAWDSPQVMVTGALAVLMLGILMSHLRHAAEPVLPLTLFGDRLFVLACAVLSLTFMGMLGASVFFPLFFQVVLGVGAAHSGLLTAPLMVGVVVSSFINGRVLLRSGRYKPAQLGGLSIAVSAFAGLAWAARSGGSLAVIEPAVLALGLGLGLVMPNMTIAVQNGLAPEHRGVGTATLAFFRSLGGLIGVAGAGAILASRLHSAGARLPLASGGGSASLMSEGVHPLAAMPAVAHALQIDVYRQAIATTFTAGAVVMAIAWGLLWFLPERPLRGSLSST